MRPPLDQQVVVITGASSGIGRAAAVEFARGGAKVVLAARGAAALGEVGHEIAAAGGTSRTIVTDVADWPQVQRLARRAIEEFGRIDTWVNNAAVSQFGGVEQSSVEEIEQVLQVNLMGQIYGMKAVLPHMTERGRGTIINVASILAVRAVPFQAAYCAAKHGLKAFNDSLRLELEQQRSAVQVTLVLPSSINTPLFRHSRTTAGVQPTLYPPIYEPGVVAEAILYAARHPRREIIVGGGGKLFAILDRISPTLIDWYLVNVYPRIAGPAALTARAQDNLFEPLDDPQPSSGEFGRQARATSFYTRYWELRPGVKRVALAVAAIGAAALWKRRSRRRRRRDALEDRF